MKKTEKPPRFIHMHNKHFERQFVVHTREPAWLAEVHEFENENDIDVLGNVIKHNNKFIVLQIIDFYQPITESKRKNLNRIIARMSEWYKQVVLLNK